MSGVASLGADSGYAKRKLHVLLVAIAIKEFRNCVAYEPSHRDPVPFGQSSEFGILVHVECDGETGLSCHWVISLMRSYPL